MYRALIALISLFSLACIASASPIFSERSSEIENAGTIFIGYNGFSGNIRPPQASTGGELGAVFYIADAVDLAKFFANGADHSKDTVCLIYADATEWSRAPKVWVPPRVLALGGTAMNNQYPGAVLFAPHTRAGLPAGAPANVYQMGIRQAQISRLKLTTTCKHKSQFPDNQHQTLDYHSLIGPWAIQTPA